MHRFLILVATGVLMALGVTSGCGEDDCLVEGENCSSSYIRDNYGDGRGCCSGLSCKEGATSGVLICR